MNKYKLLDDGSWGAWVSLKMTTGKIKPGDEIIVRSSKGVNKAHHVKEVVKTTKTGCLVSFLANDAVRMRRANQQLKEKLCEFIDGKSADNPVPHQKLNSGCGEQLQASLFN